MTTTKITNGTVFNNGRLLQADLLIEDGKVTALGHDLPAASETIDAAGKLVAPGLSSNTLRG